MSEVTGNSYSQGLWLRLLSPSFLVGFIIIDQRPDLTVLKKLELLELTDIATWPLWGLYCIVTLTVREHMRKKDMLAILILCTLGI